MKKFLFGLAMLPFVGCAEVKEASDTARDQLFNPPAAVLEALKQAFTYLVEVLSGLVGNLLGIPVAKILSFLGL